VAAVLTGNEWLRETGESVKTRNFYMIWGRKSASSALSMKGSTGLVQSSGASGSLNSYAIRSGASGSHTKSTPTIKSCKANVSLNAETPDIR
jgi:hypothetical protein